MGRVAAVTCLAGGKKDHCWRRSPRPPSHRHEPSSSAASGSKLAAVLSVQPRTAACWVATELRRSCSSARQPVPLPLLSTTTRATEPAAK
jgi:hypothetical protein